jgi:voltage-gated potassium channel Kch
MQDLAAVPMLIAVSVLAVSPDASSAKPWYLELALALGAVAVLLAGARWLLPQALIWAVRLSSMSNFAAIVIMVVMAAAVLMDLVGLSMAMGAFLVGVMLSASDFRLQVQSTVLPLKGLFMGLYFIAVGMSIDVSFAIHNIGHVLFLLVVVEVCKILAMIAAAAAFRLSGDAVIKTAFLLAPCGEFGFVLFAEARSGGVISENAFSYALVIVSLSMAITPFVAALGYAIARRVKPASEAVSPFTQASDELEGHVVIVGYNRAGRLLCMMLERAGVRYIGFDRLYSRVSAGRAEGHAIQFGDVSNPAMQGAASIAKAKLVVVMIEEPDQAGRIAEQIRGFYPSVLIYVAVPDLVTRDLLRQRGISDAIATTTEGNLLLASRVLKDTGMSDDDVEQLVGDFRKDDYALLREPITKPATK